MREYAPDVLVVDYMLTGALCGAERAGRPTVALVHTLYRELLLDGSPSPIGMAGPVAAVNEVRIAIGLAPVASHAELLDAADVVLVAAPRALDAPGEVPANVVTPARSSRDRVPTPVGGRRGNDPLVVVSLGTAGDPAESELLQRILLRSRRCPCRRSSPSPTTSNAARLEAPANVTLSGYVRHAAVMPHADLLVTHAGLGSVVVALAYGVPMVCLPLAREQPDNARAVVRVPRAGPRSTPDANAEEIRTAITEQLHRPDRVRLEPDPRPAVDLLERLNA